MHEKHLALLLSCYKEERGREIYHDHGLVLLLCASSEHCYGIQEWLMSYEGDLAKHWLAVWSPRLESLDPLLTTAVVSSLDIPHTWGCSNHVWTESFFLPLLPLTGTKQVRPRVRRLSEGPWHAQGLCHSSWPGICRTQQTSRASWSWPDLQLSYYRSTRIKYQTFLSPLNNTGIIPTSQDCHAC